MLSDNGKRKAANVKDENVYIFACTHGSNNHCSGWHTLSNICDKVNVSNKSLLTATKNRHRVSTIFASLDMPSKDRQLFYDHMGHSAGINEAIYQAPPAVMEVIKVGKNLKSIDEGIN